jgi:hypothetical protein
MNARTIAEQVRSVYTRHTEPWFVGLILFGSAVKRDVIPGCSDIDFQLFLDRSAFDRDGDLPFELACAIHRELASIDPTPFRYIQTAVLSQDPPPSFVGPVPGTYQLLAGRLPVSEADNHHLRQASKEGLEELLRKRPLSTQVLLEHGAGRLERNVRLLCTKVWPALYQVLTFLEEDAVGVWALPRQAASARLPQGWLPQHDIQSFYAAVRAYYPDERPLEAGLEVMRHGLSFLAGVREWWRLNRVVGTGI